MVKEFKYKSIIFDVIYKALNNWEDYLLEMTYTVHRSIFPEHDSLDFMGLYQNLSVFNKTE